MANVSILIGAQWGDEGKGKWVDIYSQNSDLAVRFQGGNNAGHTLYIDGKKIVLHQIPSGIFSEKTYCALSSEVVFNPVSFIQELKEIEAILNKKIDPNKLWLSSKAHVISPWSIYLDSQSESKSSNPIGTTKKGIGPTYSMRASRIGLRLERYIDDIQRKNWISTMKENEEFKTFYDDNKGLWDEFENASHTVKQYVTDAESRIRKMIYDNKKVVLEGAQGVLLDIDHGTYPYVTSSSTIALGALTSIGFSPKYVDNIYGIAKAYTTRVGEGPFPTEEFSDVGKTLANLGKEFGATTGRARRCGWLDLVALKYAVEVNGLDGIILNKIDILDGFSNIKVAVGYHHPKLGDIDYFPTDSSILKECSPIYKDFEGWNESGYSSIPTNMKKYIDYIESYCGTKIVALGIGPGRKDYIFLDNE